MKKFLFISATAFLLLSGCDTNSNAKGVYKKDLTTEKDKFSYAIGNDIAMSFNDFTDELDLDALFQAIYDKTNGKDSKISDEDAQKLKTEVFKRIRTKVEAEKKIKGEKAVAEGKKFLEENAKKDGVTVTESGLQYTVIAEGAGEKPTATDKVKVHYKGTTIDGKEFDSSYKRGVPASFGVTGVIKGWTEGLQLMTVGSKYKFVIPSELAYGPRGAGKDIAPNSVLIFEIELISIEK